jgi:hypothetical protein
MVYGTAGKAFCHRILSLAGRDDRNMSGNSVLVRITPHRSKSGHRKG